MTVLPVLLAASELRERYQGGELSGEAGGLGWLWETSRGGAEAGRSGGGGEADHFCLDDDLRSREGGESKAESILGVVGGVVQGVVGVAGWSTIASLGETSRGVSWSFLERLLGEPATSSSDMVEEERQEAQCSEECQVIDDRIEKQGWTPVAAPGLIKHAQFYFRRLDGP